MQALQSGAVDRLAHAGAALVDQQEVAPLHQRPVHVGVRARRARRAVAGATFVRDEGAEHGVLVVAGGHEGEADLDLAGDRTGAVPWLRQMAAQGVGEYVAGRQSQRSHVVTW